MDEITVKELIEQLKEHPMDSKITIYNNHIVVTSTTMIKPKKKKPFVPYVEDHFDADQ